MRRLPLSDSASVVILPEALLDHVANAVDSLTSLSL